ncbi:hypothetical protein WA026_008035 [Henosepilachna vigintioctopunctata]|uniref:HMG box domain-containing protein n=1 Tax=Henosepilachna vigintioctopunctata TaxID=420089 RepID=A0AAW1TIG9_9CUCU
MSKQHNAFYYFMLDFKSRPGQKYNSLREVAEAAGPHWTNLSKSQKKVYEERARQFKGTEKLNSDRIPVEEVKNMEREEMRYKQQMKDDIMARLSILKRRNALNTHLFFIIHVNSFCQHDFTKSYSPCEIGISAFSLQDGVQNRNVFHSMIKPGPLPLGYAATAQQHSNETHQIELPWDDEDNQKTVFEKVMAFLESYTPNGSTDELPILYAAERNLPMVVGVFDDWCDKFGVDPSRIQVYNLQYMFRILRNTVAGIDCWTSDTMSYQEIERDVYNYTPNIACEFHEMCDVITYCSRSVAVRYGFTICDNCCKDAKIELIPGCHVPENAITTSNNTLQTVKSSKKKNSTKYTSDSSSIRDDSSDVETLITNKKSGEFNYISPEIRQFDNTASSSRTSTNSAESSADASNGSYVQATSSQIGSSGFSRRPAAMPFNVTEELESLTISQESRDINFPAIGKGRGRSSGNPNLRGRGRGNPFKRTTSRF